jgi:UDP-N-acetylmuramate: L-alanyl-gamma-D-glutamyl-meso-diaminopimelate ligase
MLQAKKHIHFIGICGVAMSALAIAFHKKGYKVTGSDKGFYPPVSTYLKDAGIEYYPGWHVDKMTADGDPDLVVVGNVAGSKNPEWVYVQEKKLEYKSYPEVIAEFFVKKNSIVAAGTYGKSTSSAILAWILKENGFDPSHMFGGVPINNMPSAELTDSEHSILEGDEYKSARWDARPKFAHYSPTHLLLTSVVWDHADVYPTETSYIDAFEQLVKSIPEDGLIVLSAKVTHDLPAFQDLNDCPVVTYGKTDDNDYQYFDVETSKDGISFKIKHGSSIFSIQTSALGDYMADNMTGCFALAHEIGIAPENIIKSLKTFKNIKRRLEKRYDGDVTVFDDIAHSPKKAEAVLRSLRSVFDGHVIAVFEPNTGNRMAESIPGYANAFNNADTVIIPRLSHIKKDPNKSEALEGQTLANVIAETHQDVHYMQDDEKLIDFLTTKTKEGDAIVFLGSHGFRGMIESLVSRLSK